MEHDCVEYLQSLNRLKLVSASGGGTLAGAETQRSLSLLIDPNRQVGACFVSQSGIILDIYYNGFPRGYSDDTLPWSKVSKIGNPLETKYPYVCHAEVNAILNTKHASTAGQRLYVTMFPCNECAKIIIQSGVSEVIYFVEKRLKNSNTAYVTSHKLLTLASVKVRKRQPWMDKILINFEEPSNSPMTQS
ncbi:uncharacterized protein LOC131332985 [Rhododendron vialii]|uniref:uncharacterized protein LOC131332985 n=1 Tax=Rhododendron vialii TaxID=182163 RepID=UPI00265F880F|nr:uncharacterized protein LOC131332985 [Rhododendron vialii]